MTLWTMRTIDLWLGKFLCFVLQVFKLLRKDEPMINPQKILIIKFWGIGSIIKTTPAIKLLRDKYPKARIDFITFKQNKDICELIEGLNKVLTLELSRNFTAFVWHTVKMLVKIRSIKYDLVLDFEFFTRFSAIFSFFTNSKRKIGFHTREIWRGKFHNESIPYNCYWHVSENFINAAVGLVTTLKDCCPNLRLPTEEKEFIDKLLDSYGIKKDDIVMGINVNTGRLALHRRWPKENFIELINRFLKLDKVRMLLIGAKEDVLYVRSIIAETERPEEIIDISDKINLKQLVVLISKFNIFISNDSGPLHIAFALDIPTVSFFGPETPITYGTRGKRHKIFFKNISCSPCIHVYDQKTGRCRYSEPKCLKLIKVEEVEEAIREIVPG